MREQGINGPDRKLHWSQTNRFAGITSIFGAVVAAVITVTLFLSGETLWGFLMLIAFLASITAMTLRFRRLRRGGGAA